MDGEGEKNPLLCFVKHNKCIDGKIYLFSFSPSLRGVVVLVKAAAAFVSLLSNKSKEIYAVAVLMHGSKDAQSFFSFVCWFTQFPISECTALSACIMLSPVRLVSRLEIKRALFSVTSAVA